MERREREQGGKEGGSRVERKESKVKRRKQGGKEKGTGLELDFFVY